MPRPPTASQSVAQSRRILNAVMARSCPVHDAATGQPCWTITPDSPLSVVRDLAAVCNRRIERWRQQPADRRYLSEASMALLAPPAPTALPTARHAEEGIDNHTLKTA